MKKAFVLALLLLAAVVAFGCKAQDRQGEFAESESITSAAEAGDYATLLTELQREINILVSDARPIGQEHYLKLSERLKQLNGKGLPKAELADLENKLDTLNPEVQQQAAAEENPSGKDELAALKREIEVLAQDARPIGPEHYSKLSEKMDKLEAAGNDVAELRSKLELVKPLEALPVDESGKFKEFDMKTLPDCEGKLFTTAPVDLEKIYEIGGLGGINPPGHTLPTEHTYWHITASGQTTGTIDLYAPGDIYITEVTSTPEQGFTDYTIRFALCKDVHGYFNHAKGISDELNSVLEGIECQKWSSNPGGSCTKMVNSYFVKAGTAIGKVGHLQGNFDVGALDYRVTNKFANQARYKSRTPNIVCPFEYFTPEIKNQIYAKDKRTIEPRCGEVMQDKAGTLQGNWFYGEDTTAEAPWESHLAFVHDAGNPEKAALAIAGIFIEPAKQVFSPKSTGLVDREFSQVTADGNTYCYTLSSGKIVLRMKSATELEIEKQEGSCTGSEQLKSPVLYAR